jgi:U5 small nuclear ribonucleoprotein component
MDQLYDEFGNYLGEDSDQEDEQIFDEEEEELKDNQQDSQLVIPVEDENLNSKNQIVLHEDKKYYPSATEVYGEDVEILVHEEDTQPLTKPIIEPEKEPLRFKHEKDLPVTIYNKEYLVDMMGCVDLIRNVAIVGHLHHGKTAFMDMIISHTHDMHWQVDDSVRYTDVHMLERERGLSIKSMPMTVLLPTSKHKHYLFNFMDTPGHVNFSDEVSAGLRIADGALLVVDAVEGVMANTERLISYMANHKVPFTLCINKVDRLILELKLPPQDCFFKIKHTIEQVNNILTKINGTRLSPEMGNVCFAAPQMNWCFTLTSFARMYAQHSDAEFDIEHFARRLWGDVYFDPETRTFKKQTGGLKRSFVYFVLEPLYKLFGQVSYLLI